MLLFQSLSFLGPGVPSDDIYIEACREFVLMVFSENGQSLRPLCFCPRNQY